MLNIKKYANGQFFDTINKKYIKVATLKELIQKGEKLKVTLAKTGKDITDSVVEQLSKTKEGKKSKKDKKIKKAPFLNTKSLKKWAGKIIDKRVTQVLETIKLPSKKQIEKLDANIKALNKKIDKLEVLQKKKASKAKSTKKAAAPEAKSAKKKKTVTATTNATEK